MGCRGPADCRRVSWGASGRSGRLQTRCLTFWVLSSLLQNQGNKSLDVRMNNQSTDQKRAERLDQLGELFADLFAEIDTDKPYLDWLSEDCQYVLPTEAINGWWVACEHLMFHASMIAGRMGDYMGHDFRYCYPNMYEAIKSMAEWKSRGWEGEPVGWHKRRSLPADLTKKAPVR